MASDIIGFQPSERELSRSEEEEALLRKIREEKEQLWFEIQVTIYCSKQLFNTLQDLRRQIIDIDNDLAALDEANDELAIGNVMDGLQIDFFTGKCVRLKKSRDTSEQEETNSMLTQKMYIKTLL